ncbi:MAG: NAD(P)-dependent oxidoreductase [Candidatus Margulisbacteria bacterium]|nr:NAD(P)-dependent oxidoreductase [Candidatus Margulisiibacteriota bacterium]
MATNIFITGASGCVGHYLFDALVNNPEYSLYLLVRDPSKLRYDSAAFANVKVIQEDLRNIENLAAIIKEMDYIIHVAAAWGSAAENYEWTLDLFRALDPERCQKVIYFSTASILGPDGQPTAKAETCGTHYIRSKYRLHKNLPSLKIYPKVTTIFPTWVLGGDNRHPYSHATQGIMDLKKWLPLISLFTIDASFHYIHARDLALITGYLLDHEIKEKELIVGNAPTTASQFLRAVCAYYHVPVYFQLPISLPLVKGLARMTGHQLAPWDIYCFEQRHFVFKTVNAATFGLSDNLSTIGQILGSI